MASDKSTSCQSGSVVIGKTGIEYQFNRLAFWCPWTGTATPNETAKDVHVGCEPSRKISEDKMQDPTQLVCIFRFPPPSVNLKYLIKCTWSGF